MIIRGNSLELNIYTYKHVLRKCVGFVDETNTAVHNLKIIGRKYRLNGWCVCLVVVVFDVGMTVSGRWLKYNYKLVEMRFHWGSNNTNGSEHTLNKRRFPMEVHT